MFYPHLFSFNVSTMFYWGWIVSFECLFLIQILWQYHLQIIYNESFLHLYLSLNYFISPVYSCFFHKLHQYSPVSCAKSILQINKSYKYIYKCYLYSAFFPSALLKSELFLLYQFLVWNQIDLYWIPFQFSSFSCFLYW